MEVKTIDTDALFRAYTLCETDTPILIVDVRDRRAFAKLHLRKAFCVRLSSSGALLDESKSKYDERWSAECWWGKHVIVYGDAGLSRRHDVPRWLANEAKAASVSVYKDGIEAFARAYPSLTTASVRRNSGRSYPSQIIPRLLYLGDWSHAQNGEVLEELNIGAVVTAHNNADDCRVPRGIRHLRIALPDVETENIRKHFDAAFDAVDGAKASGKACLIHCGAGVSRSATLAMAYYMRESGPCSALDALRHAKARRSLVQPNKGFLAALLAFERELGVLPPTKRKVMTVPKCEKGNDALSGHSLRDWLLILSSREKSQSGEKKRAAEMFKVAGLDVYVASDEEDDVPAAHVAGKRRRDESERGDQEGGKRRAEGRGVRLSWSIVKEGKALERGSVSLEPGMKFVIGRNPTCDLVMLHESISREHAAFVFDSFNCQAIVHDLESTHGTNVAGVWVKKGARKPLTAGTVVKLGASTREIHIAGVEIIR